MNQATRLCPHCGVPNPIDRAVCENCGTPLTAYGKEISGLPETFERKLDAQVAQLEERPRTVMAIVALNVLWVVLWPLRSVFSAFLYRPALNANGTNATQVAFGTLGPIFVTIVMLPLAVLVGGLAWATWRQQTWTWRGQTVFLSVIGLYALLSLLSAPFLALLLAAAGGAAAYGWFKPDVKAWFGLD